MRLIDADALIFTHEIARSLDDGHNWNELCITADEIADAPTIEPKRGEWVYKPYVYDESTWECSNCKEPWTLIDGTPQDNNMNFCPNCGADMREREGE